ncbi:hypothetical protein BDZ89DRAFT_1080340 [Hymenopellis radicata]|nr:hypothetical protein BDZ89DRAFT_1080340 [Hymenopellis radicata]
MNPPEEQATHNGRGTNHPQRTKNEPPTTDEERPSTIAERGTLQDDGDVLWRSDFHR